MGKSGGVTKMLTSFVANESVTPDGKSLSRDDYYLVLPSATYNQLMLESTVVPLSDNESVSEAVIRSYMQGYKMALRRHRRLPVTFMGYTVRESVTHLNIEFVHKDDYI